MQQKKQPKKAVAKKAKNKVRRQFESRNVILF